MIPAIDDIKNVIDIFNSINKIFEKIFVRFCVGKNKLKGVVEFYGKRGELSEKWWEEFYCDRKDIPKNVVIMGQSLAKTFVNQKQNEKFQQWCNSGKTKFSILLLSPDGFEVTQIRSISKYINYKGNDNQNSVLKEKILDVTNIIYDNIVSKVDEEDKKPLIRYSLVNMPFSLICIDEDMVVTFYGVNAFGDERPTIKIRGKENIAFKSFYSEYLTIWKDHSMVSPYEDPLMKQYKHHFLDIIKLYDFNNSIPPPYQVTIYPTYRCSQNCSYCMYYESRNDYCFSGNCDDMSFENIRKVIQDLVSMGVKKIEISGGGEPLEYMYFSDLIDFMIDINSKSDISFGLLTNGANMGSYDGEKLLKAFNGYVRLSRYESTVKGLRENNRSYKVWKENLANLLSIKSRNVTITTKIGVKYLYSNSVAVKEFINLVLGDFNDNQMAGVDHYRIKSERKVSEEEIYKVEQEIYYYLKTNDWFKEKRKDVSLDLSKTVYPNNFRCWLSPMNLVIDSCGDAYICCNYELDKSEKRIGSIKTNTIKELWHSEKHKELREGITSKNCNKDIYCNCRYAELQCRLDNLVPYFY